MEWKQLQDVHDYIASVAGNIFLQHGSIAPQIMLLQTEKPCRMTFLPPSVVTKLTNSDEGRHQIGHFIRGMLSTNSKASSLFQQQAGFIPDLIVHVHEAWVVKMDRDDAPLQGRVCEDPRRQSCLLVTLHTAFGSIPVIHPIVEHPHPHVQFSEFPGPEALHKTWGRMTVQGTSGPISEDGFSDGFEAEDDPIADAPRPMA